MHLRVSFRTVPCFGESQHYFKQIHEIVPVLKSIWMIFVGWSIKLLYSGKDQKDEKIFPGHLILI